MQIIWQWAGEVEYEYFPIAIYMIYGGDKTPD